MAKARSDLREAGQVSPQILIVIFVCILLLAVGLRMLNARRHVTEGNVSPGSKEKVILRLHGSNTIGAELGPALAAEFLRKISASDIRTVPLGKEESRVEGKLPGDSSPSVIEIVAPGSAVGFKDIIASPPKCDIAMASRKANTQEIRDFASQGDLTSFACEHVLGLDGIAVIVNAENSVDALTKDQLAEIFSGAYTDWSQVGHGHGPIHLYARDDASGTFDTFKNLVLGKKPLATANVQRFADSNELSDKVSADPAAIGFIGLPYVRSAKAIAVSETETSGKGKRTTTPLLPNRLTVATEDYPLSRELYLYTAPHPANPYTKQFVDFAISKAGQDVVGAKGFIDQNVRRTERTQQPADRGVSAQYRNYTAGADRLTLNFRFRTGQTTVDNKAATDLDRVLTFLSENNLPQHNVILLGFADSQGAENVNVLISKERAETVARELGRRGIRIDGENTIAFGSQLPVASNDTEIGREKNRRVEIWVKR